ncbi:MAG: four helix bundle protein [Prosthecobacter sp.]
MSYQNLEIWQLARKASIDVHTMTLTKLPKFEMYEEGSQIRRSAKSVRSNIVEGYGRREYKQDFVLRLTYALASNDETIDHLDTLHETGSLADEHLYIQLRENLTQLGKKLNLFIQAVRNGHQSFK